MPEVFAKGGQKFADNVVAFYEKMRDEHLYVSYAIVPPQIDRSKPAHKQSDPTLYAGVVKERDDGIVISGAQQLATGGVLSDWLHLSCIHPLQPGDENYANCLAVPINAPGLKLYPRRPFALRADNAFDYPLSSRFDESDSYVVFDNVFVPWEHVFIYRNIEAQPRPVVEDHRAHARQPSGAGALRHQAALPGGPRPAHERDDRQRRGAAGAGDDGRARRASCRSTKACCSRRRSWRRSGTACCGRRPTTLYSAMAMQSEFNGRMLEMVRELAGGAFITLPSSLADLENPETAPDIERYHALGLDRCQEQIALMRLLWDFLGSEFGSRHQQYEKFYGGASFLVKQNVYRNFDWKRAGALVDAALALPPLAD